MSVRSVSSQSAPAGGYRLNMEVGTLPRMSAAARRTKSSVSAPHRGEGPGERFRALREALGLTQEAAAEKSGRIDRNYLNRIENGHNRGASDLVRGALATAYGVSRDDLAEYVEGRLSLKELLTRRAPTTGAARPGQPLLRNHPRWPELVREAQRIRPLPIEAFERLADSPFVWGPLELLDATLLADLARDVHEWAERAHSSR